MICDAWLSIARVTAKGMLPSHIVSGPSGRLVFSESHWYKLPLVSSILLNNQDKKHSHLSKWKAFKMLFGIAKQMYLMLVHALVDAYKCNTTLCVKIGVLQILYINKACIASGLWDLVGIGDCVGENNLPAREWGSPSLQPPCSYCRVSKKINTYNLYVPDMKMCWSLCSRGASQCFVIEVSFW